MHERRAFRTMMGKEFLISNFISPSIFTFFVFEFPISCAQSISGPYSLYRKFDRCQLLSFQIRATNSTMKLGPKTPLASNERELLRPDDTDVDGITPHVRSKASCIYSTAPRETRPVWVSVCEGAETSNSLANRVPGSLNRYHAQMQVSTNINCVVGFWCGLR